MDTVIVNALNFHVHRIADYTDAFQRALESDHPDIERLRFLMESVTAHMRMAADAAIYLKGER